MSNELNVKEYICDLNIQIVNCQVCGAPIFPEPSSYCDHVYFIYANDAEGMWVYQSNEVRDERFKQIEVEQEVIFDICRELGLELAKYENNQPNTYGKPTLFIGYKKSI